MKREIRLSNLIAPSFFDMHRDIVRHGHTEYWLNGGRGSCKSSDVSIETPQIMIKNPNMHMVVLRKVGNTIRDTVYSQMEWGIEQLGLTNKFTFKKSPAEMIYKPTGQTIYFLGVDDPHKLKSIKPPFGYIGVVWFEELDQFTGMEEIRNVEQSLIRGGDVFYEFFTYNPPKSRDNWVNIEMMSSDDDDRYISHTTYLTVPREWLGDKFFQKAEKLKEKNEMLYRHEYLGEVTGTGGAVFDNVEDMAMDDEKVKSFDRLYYGLDFGFSIDPLAFVSMHYDAKHEDLYIFDEIYQQQLSNATAIRRIKEKAEMRRIIADSAEPRTISEFHNGGLNVYGAKKGPDSVEHGIKWLQERRKIYIDKRRCPNTYREFVGYEYARNRQGQFISAYPDMNNHAIDATRYAMEAAMLGSNFSF